jgi:hypothetical protein
MPRGLSAIIAVSFYKLATDFIVQRIPMFHLRISKWLSILLLVMIGAGCTPGAGDTTLWFYANSNLNDENNLPLKPSHFLYLQGDDTYTCDFGVFEYGTWKRDGNKLLLTSGKRGLTVLQVVEEDAKKMQISMKGYLAEFEYQPIDYAGKADPFAIESNKWRIHADNKESRQQLTDRLRNHCEFWEAYFNWGIENDLQTLDVRSTPTPIKIYGNGIGLKSYDDLPEVWKGYFYDSTDCRQATDILKTVFRKHDIEWPKSDNDYIIFRSAFKQLQGYLK